VTFSCRDLDRALRDPEPSALEAARAHATACPTCGESLALWDEISAAAPQLRKEWPSPDLWPRIRQSLDRQPAPAAHLRWPLLARRPAFLAAAAALILALAGWLALRGGRPAADPTAGGRFLTERALRDVERSEADYVASINRLAALAEPRARAPETPLLASYREKLRLLDAAIAECRAEVERNRFNVHLRRELLAMYQEKETTLQRLMEGDS
jgi:hypothetical protein